MNREVSFFAAFVFLILCSYVMRAHASDDAWAPHTQYLHGEWEILPEHADQELFRPAVAGKLRWGKVPVPGLWSHARGIPDYQDWRRWQQVRYVWYRRQFEVPEETQYRRAVLRLAAVRWGSKLWVNGKYVGEHLGAFGVNDFDVTELLKVGETNEMVMRLVGWPALPRSEKRKQPLIPPGSAPHGWGMKSGGIAEFIALHYFSEAYIRSARIVAAPATGNVQVRARFRNYGQHYGLISARLEVMRAGKVVASASRDVGRQISLPAKHEDQFFEVAARVKDVMPWSPEDPQLYEVRLTLLHDGKVADVFTERFGFRTFEIKGDKFYLNGEPIFLRGTNFHGEYVYSTAERFPHRATIKRYLHDVPQLMHANCIRGHSMPFTKRWLEVADEAGILLLQEFPLTVNYDRFEFTPEEFATFTRNVETEYQTMVELYWNHPSIIMWVPTNESPRWEEWENGPLYQLFKKADPTRPVLRAGRVSPDIHDTHCYDGWWSGAVGDFHQLMTEAKARARRTGLPYTNTEYVENCHKRRAYRFLGPRLDKLSPEALQKELDHLRAEITCEQTEHLRRLGAQLILHYAGIQVRGWEEPKTMAPSSSFHALRNAFAPVAVSIDLFDKHFYTGHRLTTPVHIMNARNESASGTLQVAILSQEPGFDWECLLPGDAPWQKSFEVTVPAFEHKIVEVTWPLPAKESHWMLAAIWRGKGQEPVHSRRIVFTVAPPKANPLGGRKVALFDVEGKLTRWLKEQGAELTNLSKARVALALPDVHRSESFKQSLAELKHFVEKGGTLVVLEQSRWPYESLVKMETPIIGYRGGISTVFKKEEPAHPVWRDVPEELMRRWNGLPGTVARYALETDLKHAVLAIGTERTGYPNTQVAIEIPLGAGQVIFCQFKILERLHRSKPNFDPVAERILLNLLAGG